MYEQPEREAAEGKQRIRDALCVESGERAEDDSEDRGRQHWLENHPCDPDQGLFVPDLAVAERQEVKQLAILPDLTQLKGGHGTAGLDISCFGVLRHLKSVPVSSFRPDCRIGEPR